MNRVKAINTMTIFELSESDMIKKCTTYKFQCFTKDEMCQPSFTRSPEWECDTLEEMIEWIKSC